MNSSRLSLAKSVGLGSFFQAATIGTQLTLVPILSAALGKSEYGYWVIYITIAALVPLVDAGLPALAANKLLIARASGQWGLVVRLERASRSTIALLTAALACFALVLYASIPTLCRHFGSGGCDETSAQSVAPAAMLAGLATIHLSQLSATLRAWERLPASIALAIVALLIEWCALVAAAILRLTLDSMIVLHLVVKLVLVILCGRYVSGIIPSYTPSKRAFLVGLLQAKRLLGSAVQYIKLTCAQAIHNHGPVLVLSYMQEPIAGAAYAAIRTFSRTSVQAASIVNQPLLIAYGSAFGESDYGRMSRLIRATTLVGAFVGFVMVVIAGTMGVELVTAWTRGVISVHGSEVMLLAVSTAIHCVWQPLSNFLLVTNRHAMFAGRYLILSFALLSCAALALLKGMSTAVYFGVMALDSCMLILVSWLIIYKVPGGHADHRDDNPRA